MGKCFAAIAALCLIGTAYAASGDYERALELLRARKLGEAVTALTRADRDSDPRATNALAELYQAGFGVPRDETRACELFEKAAKRGVVSAQHNFGQCFFLGKGGRTQDYAQSKQWYERAIEAGGPPAFCARRWNSIRKCPRRCAALTPAWPAMRPSATSAALA